MQPGEGDIMTDGSGEIRLAELTPELQAMRERWLELPRPEQDMLYTREFAAPFARLFGELPLHGAPSDMRRPRALVSMLGLSWQPVALMAAWARPERMLVLGTERSLAMRVDGEGVLSLVARVGHISRDCIEVVHVEDPGEAEIYRAVRDFLRRTEIPPREIFVDFTGGKKSMSASTALAAFLAGTPLVYVDYGEYHPVKRIPVAGTEYPRLLTNPLEVLGDLELRDIFRAFNRSDFVEAQHLAEKLAQRLYEPREAECLANLAAGYAAWDRFNFSEARTALGSAEDLLQRFAVRGAWSWAAPVRRVLARNLRVLDALVESQKEPRPERIEDGAPLLEWYLAAARRLLEAEKASLALLLTYAAVERYVDLCLWVDFGLADDAPDYSRLGDVFDRTRYDEMGKRFFGRRYRSRELEGPLVYGNGIQLLATLSPKRITPADFGPLQGLARARNKCEFEHGFLPEAPSPKEAKRFFERAHELIARAVGGRDALEAALESYEFPVLTTTT